MSPDVYDAGGWTHSLRSVVRRSSALNESVQFTRMLLGPYLVAMPASQILKAASPLNCFDSNRWGSSSMAVHTIAEILDPGFERSTTSKTVIFSDSKHIQGVWS